MKKSGAPFLTLLSSVLLSLGLAGGSAFCLLTAFHIPAQQPVVLFGCILLALFWSLMFRLRRAWVFVLLVWLLWFGALALLVWPAFLNGLRLLYTKITTLYSKAYPDLYLPAWLPRGTGDSTLVFLTLVAFLTCLSAWTVLRRQTAVPALLFSALPLILCVVVVDTPPSTWCLLTLLGAACLLLLTQSSRRRSGGDGALLTLGLLLPVAALLVGICLAVPQRTYTRSVGADQMQQSLTDWFARTFPFEFDGQGNLQLSVGGSSDPNAINLRVTGPRQKTGRPVLDVLVQTSGTVYLRGAAYGTYTGSRWESLPESDFSDLADPAEGLLLSTNLLQGLFAPVEETISLRTRSKEDVLYTPYYLTELPEIGISELDARLSNPDGLREYTFSYQLLPELEDAFRMVSQGQIVIPASYLPELNGEVLDLNRPYANRVRQIYTQLPESTATALRELADQAGLTKLSYGDLPEAVAAFVRDSADYDLSTARMPRGADFAVWFLQDSETGYCVHFASACVAMLRALGVPARFVSGYVVQAQADQWTTVTVDNAHAWAEYYVPGIGWLPLEATPARGVSDTAGLNSPNSEATEPAPAATVTRPAQPDQTAPEPTAPHAPDQNRSASSANWLGWLFVGLGAAVSAVLLRRPVILRLRRRKWAAGSRNSQALAFRQHLNRLASQAGQELPKELEATAMKARFSQHAITAEELALFRAQETALLAQLQQAAWWKRLYYRWVLVLF